MNNSILNKLNIDMKREKAMDSILNQKGTIYRSYQDGWLKALENYDKLIKIKNRRGFKMQMS